ncbi:hypothetical protein [Bradyrhizobium cenepequi]
MDKYRKMHLLSVLPAALILAAISGSEVGAQGTSAQRRGGSDAITASRYADGVYTATGQYGGAPSFITATVTLKDGIITDVAVTTHATVPTSLDFQRRFAAAVPAVVVGKPIDQLRVGKLAGSSGTPEGFNAALQQIRDKARQ